MAYEEILTVNSSIQSKRTTKATANSSTEVLKDGELLIVRDGTNPPTLRAGDGTTQIKNLKDITPVEELKKYLPLTGGTLTGNLNGKYLCGTWLQTTDATALGSAATKICVLDGSGWIYYRTPEQIQSDIGAATVDHNHYGRTIQPTSIELSPGASAGHGGYIDFHYNNDTADYTSRIYEPVKGVLKYNDHGILSTANIVALFNVNITFTNGVATYKNSAIKSNSVTFVQWRAGAVSTLADSVLSTTPQNGSMLIIAKAGIDGGPLPVNILIINQ